MPLVLSGTSKAWCPQCPPTQIPMADGSAIWIKILKRWPVEHRITAKLSNQNHTMIAEEVRYSLTVPGMDTLYVLNAMRQMICSVMHFVCTLTVRTL